MNRGSSFATVARTKKGLVFFWIALFVLSMGMQYVSAMTPRTALAADGDPVVTLEDGVNGCNGVRPTPGSENTNKRLIGGSLVPGGSATFEISYPVDPADVAGRETFVITDCVFIGGDAKLKYSVSFVPNTENFLLTFTLQIPAGTPIGAEYCNYAKTTAAPSQSQASNRKAGPACFVVGGNISILKVNEDGDHLAGAKFHIVCTLPTTNATLPKTIIDGVSHDSHSGDVIEQNVTTDSSGRIAIQAPEGTSCVITETEAPATYDLADPDHKTLVATSGGVEYTFVDPKTFVPIKTLSITKTDDTVSYDHVGQVIGFTIVATNTGNVPQAITVNDTPALDNFSCTPTNGSSIAPTGTMTCTGTHTVTQADLNAGKFDDTACANASGATEACADDTVPGVQSPALSITKVANPTTYNAVGQTITYTIVATNTGNVTIASATITDANATLGTCTPANGSSLDPLASITCSATHSITQGDIDAGHYLNTACVDDGQGGVTEICADANVTAVSNKLLTILKTATEASYDSVGDILHYTVVATNGGNTTLAGVTITDVNATLGTCTPANGSTLAPGGTITCSATHTVTQADIDNGHYLNTACVSATDATATCADADVPSHNSPNLAIEKRVTETSYDEVGDILHYTVVATNTGNVTLHNVVVTDPKVSGLVCGDGTNLAPGASITCTATHTVTQADITAGHFLNTACVAATGIESTCDSADVPSAILTIAKSNNAPIEELELPDGKTASLPTAKEGTTVTFTLTYTVGTTDLTNGVITDVLPLGLTYVEGSATNSAEFTFLPPFNATTRTLTWTAANVTTGGTVTYQAKVNKGAAALDQPLTNVATIDSAQTTPSSDTSDVFVPVPPLAETHVPTAPPTDTVAQTEGQAGSSLPLILAILGVILLAVAFVTPVPAPVRRRNRR